MIMQELAEKGINNEIAGELMQNLADSSNENKAAKRSAERKIRQLENRTLPVSGKRNKLIAYLQSKGFPWDTISAVVDSTYPPT